MARCDAILPVAALDGCLKSTTFHGVGLRIKGYMSSNDSGPDILYEVFIKSTKTKLIPQDLRILRRLQSSIKIDHPHSVHLYYNSYQATAKVITFGIRLSNQAATSGVPSTATYPFTHTSTMCNFWFTTCQSCSCKYYPGDFEHCKRFKDNYHPAKAHLEPTLIAQKRDEYGNLDDCHNGTHVKTNPGDVAFLFDVPYCERPTFDLKNGSPRKACPYHERGGLKEKWDAEEQNLKNDAMKLTQRREIERQIMKRKIAAEESKRLQQSLAEEEKKTNKEIAKEEKKELERQKKYLEMKRKDLEGDSCCIVQ